MHRVSFAWAASSAAHTTALVHEFDDGIRLESRSGASRRTGCEGRYRLLFCVTSGEGCSRLSQAAKHGTKER
jgi:hypothetical protein